MLWTKNAYPVTDRLIKKTIMAQRFTFADAKKRIKELENQVEAAGKKAGNVILDTSDNVFTSKELNKIKFLELWAILGPVVGLVLGIAAGLL